MNNHNPVARIERSEIREVRSCETPDFAALYPGYNTDYVCNGMHGMTIHSSKQKRIPSPSGGRPGRGDIFKAVSFILSPAPRFALPNPLPEGEGVNEAGITDG
jgi:hypothetical protein